MHFPSNVSCPSPLCYSLINQPTFWNTLQIHTKNEAYVFAILQYPLHIRDNLPFQFGWQDANIQDTHDVVGNLFLSVVGMVSFLG
jgi:hypothetical protein